MRSNREFDPSEWGYLARARDVHHTVLVVLVSAAVSATASAAVIFSLVDRPVAEKQSVEAPALAPAETTSAGVSSQRLQLQSEAQATVPEAKQVGTATPATSILTNAAARAAPSESATGSTVQQPSNMAALAEAPAVTETPPAVEPAHDAAPPAKKKVKKHWTVQRWEGPPPFLRW